MSIDLTHRDPAVPFAITASLIEWLDAQVGTTWQRHSFTRAVFHRPGSPDESLSEQQTPLDQIRFYTSDRVLRGLRYVIFDLASRMTDELSIRLAGLPQGPDEWFLRTLGHSVATTITVGAKGSVLQEEDAAFASLERDLRSGATSATDLRARLERFLGTGDSWSAQILASAYLGGASQFDASLSDLLGLSFALQGHSGDAMMMWQFWSATDPVGEARARYSLAMLDARHHPRALRNHSNARHHLDRAWNLLSGLPDSYHVGFERVFNRNGLALILFREGSYAEAAQMLEDGIAYVTDSPFREKVHHTVLVSNLGRVYAASGELERGEALLREATRLDPLFAEYWQDLASFLGDRGRIDEAVATVERAISLDPSLTEAHRLLGYFHMEEGHYSAARDAYEVAAALGDHDAVLDMFKASNEAGEPAWTLTHGASPFSDLTQEQSAEAELLMLQARCLDDEAFDPAEGLDELKKKYPHDPLVEENWSAYVGS